MILLSVDFRYWSLYEEQLVSFDPHKNFFFKIVILQVVRRVRVTSLLTARLTQRALT